MRKILNHNLPVYYAPEYNKLIVVHKVYKKTIITGALSDYYSDAFTNIMRLKLPKSILRGWVKLNKRKLLSYPFLGFNEVSFGVIQYKFPSIVKELDFKLECDCKIRKISYKNFILPYKFNKFDNEWD